MLNFDSLVMLAEATLADLGVWHDAAAVASLAEIGLVCDSYAEAERMINTAALSFCGDSVDFSDILEAL
jgi:hypothetical protein